MSCEKKIRVGSRKSELALVQTKHVISILKEIHKDIEFEIVTMNTLGDKILDIPLPKIGEKSLFTKELETALKQGSVDFVVHSLKDLPTCLPPGMAIGAVLTREDPRDALVLQKDLETATLDSLPIGSTIGTSSLRRTAQLARKYPDLKVENIRGNLNTRLIKLDELGKFQAIILAAAGLNRMGWNSRISAVLPSEQFLYAVGQGALAVECRESDQKTISLLKPLYDVKTALTILAERSFLKTLQGGCSAPVAVNADLKHLQGNEYCLEMKGAVWSLDGKEEIIDFDKCLIDIKSDCSKCVFNTSDGARDIENLKYCINCPNNPQKEPDTKKQKIDVPVELLKHDPHASCPIQIPIGADFMGQCPYLESTTSDREEMVIDMNKLVKQCPFSSKKMLDQTDNLVEIRNNQMEGKDSFVGLIPYDELSKEGFKRAVEFGRKLADNLINKGASRVMATAQATIHSSIEKN